MLLYADVLNKDRVLGKNEVDKLLAKLFFFLENNGDEVLRACIANEMPYAKVKDHINLAEGHK